MVRGVHNWKIIMRNHPRWLQMLWHIIPHTEVCDYPSINKVNTQNDTKEKYLVTESVTFIISAELRNMGKNF